MLIYEGLNFIGDGFSGYTMAAHTLEWVGDCLEHYIDGQLRATIPKESVGAYIAQQATLAAVPAIASFVSSLIAPAPEPAETSAPVAAPPPAATQL